MKLLLQRLSGRRPPLSISQLSPVDGVTFRDRVRRIGILLEIAVAAPLLTPVPLVSTRAVPTAAAASLMFQAESRKRLGGSPARGAYGLAANDA